MKLLTIILVGWFMAGSAMGQGFEDNRCPYKGEQVPSNRFNKYMEDFTITTTDGVTRNLYNTLDSGKTVFIDLFYTTCTWCQYYAPVIEEIYQNTGAGQGDIEFWGISNNLFDPDSVIDQYRETYNITNPCAGPQGGGTNAHSRIISGQNFQGWPTYCVICPNRFMYFDACYPPNSTCFLPYFATCATTVGIEGEDISGRQESIVVAPNPATEILNLDIFSTKSCVAGFKLINTLGTVVMEDAYLLGPGHTNLTLSLDNIPEGPYFLELDRPGQAPYAQKLMILK